MYTCKRCVYKSSSKQHLIRHLKRKIVCEADLEDISCADLIVELTSKTYNDNAVTCELCNKKFNHKSNLYLHKKSAYHQKALQESGSTLKEVKELKDSVESETKVEKVSFWDVDYSYIVNDTEFVGNILNELPTTAVHSIVYRMYFNDNSPQNQTIKMKNSKHREIMIFEDGKWKQRHLLEVIPHILEKIQSILSPNVIDRNVSWTNFVRNIITPKTKEYKSACLVIKNVIAPHMYSHKSDSNNQIEEGFLYLVQEREFIRLNEPVFKFGRTENVRKRLSQYPKSSQLCFSIETSDMRKTETELKRILKKQFKLRDDIGLEYFEGDKDAMIECIQNHLQQKH